MTTGNVANNITSNMTDELTLQPTADGSTTFFSANFQETFHSIYGAKLEAEAKFVAPAGIKAKARARVAKPHINDKPNHKLDHQLDDRLNDQFDRQLDRQKLCILDVCYGLGYNSAAAISGVIEILEELAESSEHLLELHLEIIALENNLQVPQMAIAQNLMQIWSPKIVDVLKTVAKTQQLEGYHLESSSTNCRLTLDIDLLIGDARQCGDRISNQWADVIFLDPFSPPRCPQLWTVEFMQLLADRLRSDGCLVTYSCAAAVRSALIAAGLHIGSTTPVGRRSPGTIAAFISNSDRLPPLSQLEQEILHTRAAIPYRDRTLRDSAAAIIARRQQEQAQSHLESTSSWKRRQKVSYKEILD